MTGWSNAEIWFVIVALGVATYAIRLSFLGLIGNRDLPDWLLRHLRYTPVAILPALVTPQIVWPDGIGGGLSAAHLIGAGLAIAVGVRFKNPVYAVLAGFGGFAAIGWLLS